MKYILLLLPLLVACSHQPAHYEWTSLTGQNTYKTIVTEPKDFKASEEPQKDFAALKISKYVEPDARVENLRKNGALKIVLIGDTGCRMRESESGNFYQNCKDPTDWPAAQVMAHVATEKADLVIHMGDFHYREHCSVGKPCRQMTDVVGFGWKPWGADFFQPAKPALSNTPWIMVRGNHETCDRAYLGYKHLLTDQQWSTECPDYEEPQYIQLGDLLLVNFDSAQIEEKNNDLKLWERRFKSVEQEIKKRKSREVWFLTHRPVYGFVPRPEEFFGSNADMQTMVKNSKLLDQVSLFLGGHIHNSQLNKSRDGAVQLVVGQGSTYLDSFNTAKSLSSLQKLGLPKSFSETSSRKSWGYGVLWRTSPRDIGWNFDLKNKLGQLTMRCQIAYKDFDCVHFE